MSLFQIVALILALAAGFSYLNVRYLRWPSTIGLTFISLILSMALVTIDQSSFAQGGPAYDFGGGSIGSASALTSSLDEWTVEAWVNYDSAKTSQS